MKTGGLLRDTTHLSIGQGFRLVIQAAYFVLIARSLGPDAYGAFVTVVAMAALLGPFSGIGTQNLFVKNVRSGKREAPICWGNGILLTVLSGSLFSAVAVGLSSALGLKTAPLVVMIICFSDLVFLKVTELAAFGFAALDQMKQTSIQNVVVSSLRLAGIAALIALVHQVTLERWVLVCESCLQVRTHMRKHMFLFISACAVLGLIAGLSSDRMRTEELKRLQKRRRRECRSWNEVRSLTSWHWQGSSSLTRRSTSIPRFRVLFDPSRWISVTGCAKGKRSRCWRFLNCRRTRRTKGSQ
jgi:O-antigen/teichoic acid export membrane protein